LKVASIEFSDCHSALREGNGREGGGRRSSRCLETLVKVCTTKIKGHASERNRANRGESYRIPRVGGAREGEVKKDKGERERVGRGRRKAAAGEPRRSNKK